ncbi:hypothetical protein FQN55_007059 [Onygenales sp. PD_40]|nr:hypothetical protein FQN55_007059 [Onygenales sp. PD_40]KAK2787727.1 hypothetical protein FQN53_004750 [Emmonsiellopsis sp. PD_33]KAK2795926.1 hypothetical protein FQN51_009584 [Onygenales sp. PD_10]
MAAAAAKPALAVKSIWERKLDLLYLVFFALHVVIILAVDVTPLYPASFKPTFLDQIRNYYINTYQDKFFTEPPGWFWGYIIMEAVYHLPLSIWAVRGIMRDSPLVPIHLLLFSMQTFMTTMTCLIEAWSWADRSREQKVALSYLYAPYALFAAGLGLDMFCRLKERVTKAKRD